MAGVGNFKPIIKVLTSKIQSSKLNNPAVSQVIKPTSFASDVFVQNKKQITTDEVRKFFPDDKIGGGYFRKEMYKVKLDLLLSSILHPSSFKIWLHSVDLSNPLKEFDYKQITDFMNMYNGKFADVWKSEKDGMRNIEKLALFVRSLHHLENSKQVGGKINKLEFFKNLKEEDWTICMDGIVNRPKEVIRALMRYKYSSDKINKAVLLRDGSTATNNFIQTIENFLNKQVIKNDIKTYRGEKDFRIFGNTRLSDGRTLKDAIEDATAKIENGEWGEEKANNFAANILSGTKIKQNRFMSTAIIEEDTEK